MPFADRLRWTGFIIAFVFSATPAKAAPTSARGARIVWARGEGADACVGAVALAEDVKSRLGWNPFSLPVEIEVEGIARRTATGFRADLAFRNAQGQPIGKSQLESRNKDCRSLGEAVAVAITVAVDPAASGANPSPVEEVPPDLVEPPPPVRLAPPPPPRDHVRVTLSGGGSAGLVPRVGTTVSLRSAFILGARFEAGVGATYIVPTREQGYGFGLAAAEARGCVSPWGARGLLRVCGAVLVGAFEAYVHSGNVTPVEVGVFPWVGAEAGPVLSLSLAGPVRLEAGTSAVVPLVRRQGFVRGASEPVWEQSSVGICADLGLGALF